MVDTNLSHKRGSVSNGIVQTEQVLLAAEIILVLSEAEVDQTGAIWPIR